MAKTLSARKGNRISRRWIAVIVLLLVVGAAAVVVMNAPRSTSAASAATTVAVTRGNIVGSVSGSGSVTAEQTLDMAFQASGTVTQVSVKAGDTVSAGDVLAQLDDRSLQVQVVNAQAALDGAKARLQQAQKGNARPEDITSAQASVASAQAAYNAAVKDAGAGDSRLASLKAILDKSQAALDQAQAAYDRAGGAANPNIGMLPQSTNLQNATIDYQKAKSDYMAQLATSGPDAQSKIQSALTALQQAQANLAKLNAPATDTDLAIQQAAVTQAEQALKQAQLNLENATLRAPFGGIITTVNITEGSQVSPAQPAFRLINRHPLHLNLKLSENDVVKVQMDQPVDLTIDSLPDWQAQGKVSYISPASELTNGVVTYAVQVQFPDSDPRVKVGMTANLNIVTARKNGVLLVPNAALLPKGSGHVVQMIGPDGKPKEVEVVTGLSDGVQTEIVGGLNEGDRIVALPGTGTRPANPFAGGQ